MDYDWAKSKRNHLFPSRRVLFAFQYNVAS